jgi:hypothetical protein
VGTAGMMSAIRMKGPDRISERMHPR